LKWILKKITKMETQTQPRLTGVALFRKMAENKKIMQAQAVEDYKNNPKMQAIIKELRENNAREKELRESKKRKNVRN
jgi:hypothetical protein